MTTNQSLGNYWTKNRIGRRWSRTCSVRIKALWVAIILLRSSKWWIIKHVSYRSSEASTRLCNLRKKEAWQMKESMTLKIIKMDRLPQACGGCADFWIWSSAVVACLVHEVQAALKWLRIHRKLATYSNFCDKTQEVKPSIRMQQGIGIKKKGCFCRLKESTKMTATPEPCPACLRQSRSTLMTPPLG